MNIRSWLNRDKQLVELIHHSGAVKSLQRKRERPDDVIKKAAVKPDGNMA